MAAALVLSATAAQASDALTILLDQATLAKLPERVVTIVVGNPLIADVSLQPGGTMVLTGKSYGVTNFVALDRSGSVLLEKQLVVRGPNDRTLHVYRGDKRETWSCQPECQPRVTLGDSPEFFGATIGQAGVRNTQSAATPASR